MVSQNIADFRINFTSTGDGNGYGGSYGDGNGNGENRGQRTNVCVLELNFAFPSGFWWCWLLVMLLL